MKKFRILSSFIEPEILKTIQILSSVNKSISNINVKGNTNAENLLLWDKIKIYYSVHFSSLIFTHNPYLIGKSIVTKNGISSAFSDEI
jgi:hypothetical protein